MNILFVYPHVFDSEKGGIQRVTTILSSRLSKMGHQVFYLNSFDSPDFVSEFISFKFPFSGIEDSRNVDFYQKLIQENAIEVVINQAGCFVESRLYLNILSSNVLKISVLHSIPMLDYDVMWYSLYKPPFDSFRNLVRFFYIPFYISFMKIKVLRERISHFDFLNQHSDIIVTLADSYTNDVRKRGVCTDKYIAIPNPNTYEKMEVVSVKEKIILFVGRFSFSEKRPDRLLHVWKNIYRRYPDWKVVFLGDGPYRHNMEEYVTNNNIERVSFEGFKNPFPFYQKASVLCMTSNFEGFPMTLTEGMQLGVVPIVFDSFSAVNDVVIDEYNGILVKAFDMKSYQKSLCRLMDDDRLLKEYSNNAKCYVSKFDADMVLSKWINIINSLNKLN